MIRRNLIIPIEYASLADTLCSALAGPAGAGMFTTRLQPVDGGPISHVIASGLIEEQFAALLDAPGQPDIIFALAQQQNVDISRAELGALLIAADVSEGDPFERMAALGLKLEQTEV